MDLSSVSLFAEELKEKQYCKLSPAISPIHLTENGRFTKPINDKNNANFNSLVKNC